MHDIAYLKPFYDSFDMFSWVVAGGLKEIQGRLDPRSTQEVGVLSRADDLKGDFPLDTFEDHGS